MISAILILGFLLRIVNINQSFWLDEAISAIAARSNTYTGLVASFSKFDFHPPLYYLLLKFWGSVFGFGDITLRLMSVMFGVLTICVVYLIAKELKLNFRLAGLLMATSPLHVYYSQEVRMYPVAAFFVAMAFLIFFKLQKKSSRLLWTLFSLVLVLSMALDYMPIFVLPVFLLATRREGKDFNLKLLISLVPLLVVFIFWLPTFYAQIESGKSLASSLPLWAKVVGGVSTKEIILVWVKFVMGRITFFNKTFYVIFTILISIPFGLIFLKAVKDTSKTLVMWLVVPILSAFVFSFFIPVFSYFRFLYLLPAFYLIIANIDRKHAKKIGPVLIIINLICLGIYFANRNLWREDWLGAVKYVENQAQQDDVAVFEFNEPVAGYNWYKSGKILAYGGLSNQLENVTKAKGVFYFEYLADLTDPNKELLDKINKAGFKNVKEVVFTGVGKITYLKRF